jgi:hypothetical protein
LWLADLLLQLVADRRNVVINTISNNDRKDEKMLLISIDNDPPDFSISPAAGNIYWIISVIKSAQNATNFEFFRLINVLLPAMAFIWLVIVFMTISF